MCGNEGVGTSPRSPATRGTNESGGVQSQLIRGPGKRELGSCRSTQNAGREPAMPAAGPLSPGSALQKRLLVTGRERRQPRAHAQPPPPGHTHTRTRCRRLPPPPAGFLPLRGPGCSGGLRRASDPAPTRPPFPIRVRRLQPASPLPSSPPPLPPTPLQLLATPLRQPATPVPGPGPASGPAQRAPPPSPRQPARASPPLSAGAAPSAAATHCAGLRAGRWERRSSGSADPSCRRAGLPPPAAGMPRAAGPRATSAVERSGSARARPPAAQPAAGVSGTGGGGAGRGGGRVQT